MRTVAWLWVACVGVLLTSAPKAQALTEPASPLDPQPLNVPVPVSPNEITDATNTVTDIPMAGNYVSLPALFKYRKENIDFQKDAKTEPSTFSPLCSFSGTLVLRGGGCKMTFGWYNATQSGGTPPADNEIYPLIPNNDPTVYAYQGYTAFTPLAIDPLPAPGPNGNGSWKLKTFTASDIRNDARYKGGEIGFALVKGDQCTQTKYSQRDLNQQCTNCTPKAPFITTVVYSSTVEDHAYYLAFEDLAVSPTQFTANNDGDFNDFVFYITGLVCAGGGEPCDTGMQGACAVGKTDCSEDGKAGQCRQVVKPSNEACDNVDNDCNGKVDDGDLCPAGKVCDHGMCVAACGTGEFRCPQDLACDSGFCVDPLCKGVKCDMGKACRAGKCVGACDGVTCPSGQECQLGRCVDLCAGVTCLDKQVCENGLCLSECGCRACGAGKTCGAEGKCVDTGCEKQTCQAGQVCVAGGMCKDACEGAVCPGGGACVSGQCQAPMMVDPSAGTGGTGGDPGIIIIPTSGSGGTPTAIPSGGGSTAAAGTGTAPNAAIPVSNNGQSAGCNCRAASAPAGHGVWSLIGLGLAAVAARSRARRGRRAASLGAQR